MRLVVLVDQQGFRIALDDGFVDHHLADIIPGGNVVHGIEQHRLENRPKPTGAGLALHGPLGDGAQSVLAKVHFDTLHFQQLAVLLGERVLRLSENLDQRVDVEFLKGSDDRQPPDELGNQAVAHEVFGLQFPQHFTDVLGFVLALHLRGEADTALLRAIPNDLVQARESPSADEQDIRRIHLQEFLLGMLATTLGWNRGDGSLDQLEQRLLHALTGNVTGDGGVVRLARDLVNLVDVDDAHLGLLDIVIALLQQLLNDIFHVLADVARLGEGRGVGDGEGDVQKPGQGFSQQRLAAARRAHEQDVTLAQLDLIGAPAVVPQSLVVVVNGHRQHLFGALLADDVLVEDTFYFLGHGQTVLGALATGFLHLLPNNVITEVDALVANEDGGSCNQLADFVLTLAAERAIEQLATVITGIRCLVSHLLYLKLIPVDPLSWSLQIARPARPSTSSGGATPASITLKMLIFREQCKSPFRFCGT